LMRTAPVVVLRKRSGDLTHLAQGARMFHGQAFFPGRVR
jgi:hypothetical protein